MDASMDVEVEQSPNMNDGSICQEIEDNEIKWKFQEILLLLRSFKEHLMDFQQIANKMKASAETNMRPKNFYTAEMCESAFRKILSISKDKPHFVEFFTTIPYSEQLHGIKLLEQYEDYASKIAEFVDKTLLNDKFKNMLMAMEKGELSSENALKMQKFCSMFPSLLKMAVGIDDYDKTMETKSVFESLMPGRQEMTNFTDLQITLNAKLEEFKAKKEAEAAAEASTAQKKKSPSSSLTPKPFAEASTSKKKKSSSSSFFTPRPAAEASTSKKKKPSSSSLTPKPPLVKLADVEPVTPAEHSSVHKRGSSISSKKSVTSRKNHVRSSTCDAETQTNLCLVVTPYDSNLPPLIYNKFKNTEKKNIQSTSATRNIKTQTGKIYLHFANDMETFKWFDDGEVPNEMTLQMATETLRSNTDFEVDKPIRVNMNLKEDVISNPYEEKLKEHPLYNVLEELKNADADCYFHYPVKIEVPDYPSWIKHPMDLLTIEDLMIHGKINDIDDLEIYANLIPTNAVAFGAIEKPILDEFSQKIAQIFNSYRTLNG